MIGERIEERRFFALEERKAIHKANYGICACCGKKLTVKTMTIEHIIPLSRGGTNDFKNLTILCHDCNQLKGNFLYLPNGFYSALRNKPRYKQMQDYVADWFQNIKEEFDVERYPLISPRFYMQIDPTMGSANRSVPFLRQMLLRWEVVGNDLYAEVEAVTGIVIRERREAINQMMQKEQHPVALYVLKNPRTDKLLSLIFLAYDKEGHCCIMDMAWCDLVKHYQGSVLKSFILYALNIFEHIFKQDILKYIVMTPYEDAIRIMFNPNASYFGESYRYGQIENEAASTEYHIVDVMRRNVLEEVAQTLRTNTTE